MASLPIRLLTLGNSIDSDLNYLQSSACQVGRYDVYSWVQKQDSYQKQIQSLRFESPSVHEHKFSAYLLQRVEAVFLVFKETLETVVNRNARELAPQARTRSQMQDVQKAFVGLGLMKDLLKGSGPIPRSGYESAQIYEAYTGQEIGDGDVGDGLRKALEDGRKIVETYTL